MCKILSQIFDLQLTVAISVNCICKVIFTYCLFQKFVFFIINLGRIQICNSTLFKLLFLVHSLDSIIRLRESRVSFSRAIIVAMLTV